MTRTASLAATVLLQVALLFLSRAFGAERWTAQQAHEWYDRQPWLVGANYTPANAINPLEMWQADTFDPATIDKELGWARAIAISIACARSAERCDSPSPALVSILFPLWAIRAAI